MAGQKILTQVAGLLTEVVAVQVGGAPSANKVPSLDAAGRLDTTMMPTGVGADTAVVAASENLAAGDWVNVWSDAGTPKVRKADATTAGKEAMGFVIGAATAGQNATVYFEGSNTGVTGMTAGRVYLSTTPGVGSNTPPSAAGNIVQLVGFATAPTIVNAQILEPIVLA